MLKNLKISNYALIEKSDIDFSSGFSVITGETGAGKSIILGAIGLLLWYRNFQIKFVFLWRPLGICLFGFATHGEYYPFLWATSCALLMQLKVWFTNVQSYGVAKFWSMVKFYMIAAMGLLASVAMAQEVGVVDVPQLDCVLFKGWRFFCNVCS